MEILYPVGTEVHVITRRGFHYQGPVVRQIGDFLMVHDRRNDREQAIAMQEIERVEVIS